MEKVTEFLNQLPTQLTPIGIGVGVICFIIAGILMMTGNENAGKAKKWVAYICIGVALIFFAAAIVSSIQGIAE